MKRIVAIALVLVMALSLCACDSIDYKKAVSALEAGDFTTAREMFVNLGDYENSAEMVKKCDYQQACAWMEEGKYIDAIEKFEELGTYEDSQDKHQQCIVNEVDGQLQGVWEITISSFGTSLSMFYKYENGKISAYYEDENSNPINEGSYRIDADENIIYVCYDFVMTYTQSTGEYTKKPNTEESAMFSYTLENGQLQLESALGDFQSVSTDVKKVRK